MKMSLVLAVTLLIVGGSFIQETQAHSACSDVIKNWSLEGCVLDSKDNCVPNNNAECGWGMRNWNYYCGPTDGRICDYFCYKPCDKEILPVCPYIDGTNCMIEYATPCSAKCGVGQMTIAWGCTNKPIETCNSTCCCEKCTGQGGSSIQTNLSGGTSQTPRVCTKENMAITNSAPERYCPFLWVSIPR